ncbi:hypothetical protein [Streptomyces sp. TE5632]
MTDIVSTIILGLIAVCLVLLPASVTVRRAEEPRPTGSGTTVPQQRDRWTGDAGTKHDPSRCHLCSPLVHGPVQLSLRKALTRQTRSNGENTEVGK